MDALPPSSPGSTPTASPFPPNPTTTSDDYGGFAPNYDSYLAELERERDELVARDADKIREKCKSLAAFVRAAWHVLEPETRFIPNWHIDAICKHLEAITFGRMKPRLIINVPPGSMKSLLVSVMWMAWMWGPCGLAGKRFLSTSFELGNVERDVGKARDLIQSKWFQDLWPTTLTRSTQLIFANEATGGRVGVAFTALMGKRGDVLTIDDPHSLDGAESDRQRTNAVKRFLEGGKSRVNDRQKSAIVIIMQRIHTDDLAGAVLAEDLGYVHLMIPMEFDPDRSCVTYDIDGNEFWRDPRDPEAEPLPGVRQGEGELMDPRRFPKEEADAEKKQSYSWSGQYQQQPVPREGNLFMVDRLGTITASPGGGTVVRGWDLAGTKRKKSAFTVGLKLRRIPGQLIIEDVVRIRGTPFEVKDLIKKTAVADGMLVKQSIPQDPGSAGVHQKQDIATHLDGHNFRFSTETGDKEFRAQGIASQVEAEQVVMVKAPWNQAFKEELRSFPNSLFKDQVDALSRAYAELVGAPTLPVNDGPEVIVVGQTNRPRVQAGAAKDPWGPD